MADVSLKDTWSDQTRKQRAVALHRAARIDGVGEAMRRVPSARILIALVAGLVVGDLALASEIYAPQTLDHHFRLEWAKAGPNVNGYVYSSANRYAVHMQLVVEGLDGSGKVVSKTLTWIREVPPNNRAFFGTAVQTAAAYRVRILSVDWIESQGLM